MLTASELSRIQSDVTSQLLPDTCNILSLSTVNTGQGGVNETWGTVSGGSAIPCRVDAFSSKGASSFRGSELLIGGKIEDFSQFMITLISSAVLTVENRIEVNSQTYNVIVIDNGKSWIMERRAIVEKI